MTTFNGRIHELIKFVVVSMEGQMDAFICIRKDRWIISWLLHW